MTEPRARSAAPPERAALAPARGASWWGAFRPAAQSIDARERLRVVVGGFLGILVTAVLSHWLGASTHSAAWPWLVAPLGASAVLVFGVPASPLAQPWAVVGGNTVSALVGIVCVRWIGPPELAAAAAVGGALAAMFALRCLHPPGGASALLVALTGMSDPAFALHPVFVNSLLLVLAGLVYNNATRRAYPHRQIATTPAGARDAESEELDAALSAVLARHNQVLDISRDDLKSLLADTQLRRYQHKLDSLRCGDIMSKHPITVRPGSAIETARALLIEHRLKALPVIDAGGAIVGIVTRADLIRPPPPDAPAPTVVAQVMTRQVRVASVNRHLAELIPLFGSSGHHHIPIVGAEGTLVGILTQSDVVAALARTVDADAGVHSGRSDPV